MKEPKTRGGYRKGAGRKPLPEPIARISTTIYAVDLAALRSIAPSFREAIRKLLTSWNSR